jgi:hypothetical protein
MAINLHFEDYITMVITFKEKILSFQENISWNLRRLTLKECNIKYQIIQKSCWSIFMVIGKHL